MLFSVTAKGRECATFLAMLSIYKGGIRGTEGSREVTEEEEVVQKGYDKIAGKYQANRHVFDNRKEMEEFVDLLPKNATVLDAGCGAGVPFVKSLTEAGFAVIGVDFSESMLKLARKNVPEASLWKEDMTKLSFKDNSFDGLTASYSIIHVPREKHYSLFKSFHRILKPKGVMLMSLGLDEWEELTIIMALICFGVTTALRGL